MYLKSKAKEPRAWIHVIPCIECYVLYNDNEWVFFFFFFGEEVGLKFYLLYSYTNKLAFTYCCQYTVSHVI